MTKPVILIIDNSISTTGALKSILSVALDNMNDFEFHFVLPSKSSGKKIVSNNGFTKIVELPMVELKKSLLVVGLYVPLLIYNSILLNRYIRKHRVSIIHLNDIYNLLPIVMRLLGGGAPYVCHIRFLPNRFPKWLFNTWFKWHSRYSERIIAVSKATKNLLPINNKVEIVYDTLPHDEHHPALFQKQNDQFYFLYLSNFIQGKGQDFALDAFSAIHHKLPNWKLRFVGGDMGLKKNEVFKRVLQNRAVVLGIDQKIEWEVLTQDVEVEYKRADVVLNFSESESFSMICLESLYFGRPLIVTDSGGPAEIVINEKNGLLIPNRDVNAMSIAMERLATDGLKRQSFSKIARETVVTKFSKQNTSQRINQIYKSILSK